MKKADIIPAWGNILRGRRPFLSVEITRECPLRCPGCYAYQPEHLGAAGPLRQLSEFKGEALVAGVMALVRRFRPLHLSIVGGEPLVRYRELDVLLPKLERLGVEVQLVTSAVRPIPTAWRALSNLHLAVSVDGLQPEHDRRRAPDGATPGARLELLVRLGRRSGPGARRPAAGLFIRALRQSNGHRV